MMKLSGPVGGPVAARHRAACPTCTSRVRCALKVAASSSSSRGTPSPAEHDSECSRRSLLLAPLGIPSAAVLMSLAGPAHADVEFSTLSDDILAYSFKYPLSTTSGKPLKMSLARVPEKYSSAAPLTADARQRIVSEILDFSNYITASVSVGPASGVLQNVPPEQWKAKDVALTVLIDKSTSRMSSGQRFALNDVEEAHTEERDGQPYWVYEHRSQGSPTLNRPTAKETFRHALAVTGYRRAMSGEPYLYTLNVVCPEEVWKDLEGPFREVINSFRLGETTDAYIPPDKDPWRFF